MSKPAPTPRTRHLPLAAALACALFTMASARAADHGDAHADHAPSAVTKEKPAEMPKAAAAKGHEGAAEVTKSSSAHGDPAAGKTAASAGGAAIEAPVDPLDAVREKLAARLGGTKAPDSKNPYVVRVATRATGELQVAANKPTPRTIAHSQTVAAVDAAALAAAHRAGTSGPAHAAGDAHWSYKGEGGPQAWGSMKPEFSACSTGTRQSPIDIRDGITVDLDPVQFDYRPSGFGVIDNGHTVQVNVAPGNSIQVMGRRFDLAQFHFHRPSEERINGRQFDMVVHLVHKDMEGRLAVVAVLLDRGSAQPLVQTVWNNLPLEKGEEVPARVSVDLNELLPKDRRYYTYMGSLTTPPCSEGVLWMVMQQPVPISPAQIDIFSRLYPMNARPVQSASGRLIKQSN